MFKLTICDILTFPVATLPKDSPIKDALANMHDNQLSTIVVMEEQRPVGICTKRDMVRLESSHHYNASTLLKDVMTHPVRVVPLNIRLLEAFKTMRECKIRRLVVVDNKNMIVGIVTYHDIVKKLYNPQKQALLKKVEAQKTELTVIKKQLQKEREFRRIKNHLLESQRVAKIGSWEFDLITNLFWWSNQTFHILEMNATTDDASFENFLALVHPEDRAYVTNSFEASIANHTIFEIVYRLLFDDGRVKYLHEYGEPYYNHLNQPIRMVGTVQDITKSKQLEMRYRLMFQQTGTCMGIVEADGTFSMVNKTFAKLAESTVEELEGTHFVELIETSDQQKIITKHIKRLNGEEEEDHYEFRFISKKGNIGIGVLHAVYIEDTRQTIVSILDITQRKEHEEIIQSQYTMLNSVLNTTPDLIFFKDYLHHDGKYLGCNKAFETFVGKNREEIINHTDIELFGIEIGGLFCAKDKEILTHNKTLISEEWVDYPNNTKRVLLSTSKSPYKNKEGEVMGVMGISRDITEKYKLNKKLQSSHDMLHKLTQNVPGTLYQYQLYPDGKASFPYASEGIHEVYEVTPQEVIEDAQAVLDVFHPNDFDTIVASIQKSAKTLDDWSLEYRVNLPQKGVRWLEGFSKPEKLEDGSILWHGYIHDITVRKNAEKELLEQKRILDYQAHHDALTGLPNRVLFHDRLTKAIKKAKRNDSKIALLFIDLDNFKEINDSLGHDMGDEVLKNVTSLLQKSIREQDSLARLGGDEFTIILEQIQEIEDASMVAKKILENFSPPINTKGKVIFISCSIGISIYPNNGVSVQNLLKFADSAMYKAKDKGKNNFQYYDEHLTERAFERVFMESSLRMGIQNNEFMVYYQPQVNGVTDTITGIEALVRWNHPHLGLVAPNKFIPLAESTGLIIELDRIVMRTAISQLVSWYNKGLNPGVLALNLCVKQLHHEDFISMFKALLNETHCNPRWIELEVTETQIMRDPEEAIRRLQKLSEMGIELAIDDFGTGYSSLAYLKKLPLDKLKIDQTFVRDLPDDEEDAGIIKAVIALSKSLNLKVIAEGVETKEQKDFIVENGCESIQGYYYAKPIPHNELEALLRNGFE